MFTPWMVNDRGLCQLMICREHIRASKDALQIFLWLMVLCNNWHFKSNFALLSSFWLWFQRIKNGFGCFYLNHCSPLQGYFYMRNTLAAFLSESDQKQHQKPTVFMVHFHSPTLIPIPIIVLIPIVCRSAPLGPIPMVIPMQITDTLLVYSKNWLLFPLIHYWPV